MGLLPLSSLFGHGPNALHLYAQAWRETNRHQPLPVVAQIGLASYLQRDEHGAVSALARQYEVDRSFVYDCERRVRECLSLLADPQVSSSTFSLTVRVDREQLMRATIGARVDANNSYRDIMKLHEHYYGLDVSFGWVQKTVVLASQMAQETLREQHLGRIESAALDELFGQGEPVFIGIDLDTEYLFLLKHAPDRKALTWQAELIALKEQGLALKRFVCDAGKGVCAGAAGAFPQASSRRDPFHVLDVLFDALRREERHAYARLAALFALEEEVEELAKVVASLKAQPKTRAGRPAKFPLEAQLAEKQQELDSLKKKTGDLLERHDRVLRIIEEVMELMEFVSLTGELRRSAPAAARLKVLADELAGIKGKAIEKAATYLKNCASAVCSYIDEVARWLMAVTDDEQEREIVRATAVFWRLAREEEREFHAWRRSERLAEASALIERLAASPVLAVKVKALMTQTMTLIEKRARASSLAECVGSVLRPYLAVHKRVTQEALDLFCYWWNFRKRTEGKLKGSCPFTALTGIKVHDWLTYLGLPQSSALH